MTDYEINTLNRIGQLVQEGKLSNEFLVNTCKLCADFLNLQKVAEYAKEKGISRQAAYKHDVVEIFGTKFVIDNE